MRLVILRFFELCKMSCVKAETIFKKIELVEEEKGLV
jgi:hypothetical protein